MARILAVDADPLALAVIGDAAWALGHDVVLVGDGPAALARAETESFDVVLAGVDLPGLDGLGLAARLADRRGAPPVVLVGGRRRPDLTGAPVAGFLAQPVDADRLGHLLDALLARRAGPRPRKATPAAGWSAHELLAAGAGTLETFPPVKVLFAAHCLGSGGALVVESGGETGLVGLRGGKVVHASGVLDLVTSLGPQFVQRDLARATEAAVRAGIPVDQALAAAGEGLGAWLAGLSERRGGSVRFDAAWSPAPGAFPLPERLPRLLAAGLARVRAEAQVLRAWRERAGATIRFCGPSDVPDSAWGIDATATRLVRLLREPTSLESLLRDAGAKDDPRRTEVLRALDTLHAFGLVAVDAALPTPRQAAALRADDERTQEDPRASRLAQALEVMGGAHPLEVLELAGRKVVKEEDVANAYREISRRFHPDTYFNAPPAIRSLAEACFSRVNEAYDTLRAPGGLAEARRWMEARSRGETFVSEKDHLAARVAFRRAEVLFRGRNWAAADPLFQEAARLDPRTWPHAAMSAWCGWLARRLTGTEAVAALDALQAPDKPKKAEACVYAGTILKQEGRPDDAIVRFRAALEQDPDNRDAQREVRLHDLRNPPKPEGGGGLGGLFSRKKE